MRVVFAPEEQDVYISRYGEKAALQQSAMYNSRLTSFS